MTRTARSKHWRHARVQPDPILQAEPPRKKKRLSFFWPVFRCQVGLRTEKGERYSFDQGESDSAAQSGSTVFAIGNSIFGNRSIPARGTVYGLTNQEFRPDVFSSRSCLPLASRCAVRGPGKASRGCWISTWWSVHSRRAPCAGVADGRLSDEQDEGGRTQPRAGPRFTSPRRAPSSPVDSTF